MTVEFREIRPYDIEAGMLFNGRIVYSTTYYEDGDYVHVHLAGRGSHPTLPLGTRLILVTEDDSRPRILAEWPKPPLPSAERDFRKSLARDMDVDDIIKERLRVKGSA